MHSMVVGLLSFLLSKLSGPRYVFRKYWINWLIDVEGNIQSDKMQTPVIIYEISSPRVKAPTSPLPLEGPYSQRANRQSQWKERFLIESDNDSLVYF